MNCSEIIASLVGANCDQNPIGGTAKRAILINYYDIDRAASTIAEDGVTLQNLALKSGAKAHLFTTMDNATEASATFNKGTYFDTYDHSVTLRIYVNKAEAKAWLKSAKGSRIVIILERRAEGECHWEVYGWDSGLVLKDNPMSTTYSDHVVFAPVFATDDTSKEGDLPMNFFKDSSAATETAILALIADSEED